MNNFKHSLEKTSKKYLCPSCGKKTFSYFINLETNERLEEKYGRCDRIQNCGYFLKPEQEFSTFQKKSIPEKKKTSYIPKELFCSLVNPEIAVNDNFTNFLLSKYSEEKVLVASKKYLISNLKGQTIFWQIDLLENVRTGKIMEYNPDTGKRVKDEEGIAKIGFIHKYYKLKNFVLNQCLFGLDLANNGKEKIAIVESEKTAIIMSIEVPDFTWMSCGSVSGLKLEYLSIIKNRSIIAFPDKGCFNDWKQKSEVLNNFGFDIVVSDVLENTEYDDGIDIADLYV